MRRWRSGTPPAWPFSAGPVRALLAVVTVAFVAVAVMVAAHPSTATGRPTPPAPADLIITPPGDFSAGDGPFDLDRYASRFASAESTERDILRDAGFARGFTRRTQTKITSYTIYLFEFGSSSGARQAESTYTGAAARDQVAERLTVESIAGATGSLHNEPFRYAEVIFRAGRLLVFIQVAQGGPRAELVTETLAVAEEQAHLLGLANPRL